MSFSQIAGDAAECPLLLFANPSRNRVPQTMGGASVADAIGMRPGLVSERATFPKRALFGNVASRYYQNGAIMCQLTGARRLYMALEALLIAVTLAKHLKFNGFKNFEGLGLEPLFRAFSGMCAISEPGKRGL
jgi:hypothetical protein